ncbi:MAG TPA: hypothetical protein VGW40_03375 [Allosphingosinicella sp.]|nr:hypothetical protein [Allosphingosinicella sp.]
MTPEARWEACRRSHLERDFGASGRRRVRMTVMTGGKPCLHYDIDHAWRREGPVCGSILVVQAPAALRGTFVRMIEAGLSPDLDLELKLSTATHILTIAPERQRQQVLGTDFTYEDLRFWRPLAALELRSAEPDPVSGDCVFRLARDGCGDTDLDVLTARPDGEVIAYQTSGSTRAGLWTVAQWAPVSPPSPNLIRFERLNRRFETRMALLGLERPDATPADLFAAGGSPKRVVDYFLATEPVGN